jgi:hypothetical protein
VVHRSEHAQRLLAAQLVHHLRLYLEVVPLEEDALAFESELLARQGQAWDHGEVVMTFASTTLGLDLDRLVAHDYIAANGVT